MNFSAILRATWQWNAGLALLAVAAGGIFRFLTRRSGGGAHFLPFVAALILLVFALCSPVRALAAGCLFSAHMAQHLLLLMAVPALVLFSLPPRIKGPAWARKGAWPLLGWIGGIGAMWFWHVPALCDAAAESTAVGAVQSVSLVTLGFVFWWPIFAPHATDRLAPWAGVAYLFSSCLACTALGILLTLTPVEVCPVFRAPLDPYFLLPMIRGAWGISPARDRAIGGLLMWVPLCAMYVGAILLEVARWYGDKPARFREAIS